MTLYFLRTWYFNFPSISIFLLKGLSDFSNKLKARNEQQFQNLTSELGR